MQASSPSESRPSSRSSGDLETNTIRGTSKAYHRRDANRRNGSLGRSVPTLVSDGGRPARSTIGAEVAQLRARTEETVGSRAKRCVPPEICDRKS